MARARRNSRKTTATPSNRLGIALAVLVVIFVAGLWVWQRGLLPSAPVPDTQTAAPPAPTAPASTERIAAPRPPLAKVEPTPRKPLRDTDLGITAPAASALLRIVEMYQWHERCDLAGNDCAYSAGWSEHLADSRRFRVPRGHENPAAMPLTSQRFGTATNEAAAVDYPIPSTTALPPNLAASFSIVDGALYAGGDAAHPQIGALRIRYRIVPAVP